MLRGRRNAECEDTGAVKPGRILIVDDMMPMRAFIKAGIRSTISKDIEIDEASSGEAAKGKLEVQRYDLVLCDWNLPGLKGTELLQWMREQDALKNTPVIMLTANNKKEIIQEAIELGAADYVIKPVTADVLGKKVSAVLRASMDAGKKNAEG